MLAVVAWLLAAPASATENLGGLELKAPVRHQLWRLQESWQRWTQAWASADEEAAAAELEQMQAITRHLGMSSLPDLSGAAAAHAVRAAREGDFARARWSLEAARRLDPGRPENAFARSTVQRLEGDYVGAALSLFRGYTRILETPLERTLWLGNLGLWALYTLLLSGGLFVALLVATKGGALFYDLTRLLSPPLQRPVAHVLTLLLLLWPVLLPSGFLWLALYWSILLWGYGSNSERGVLIGLWLLLGVTPALLAHQQRAMQMALVPPARLIDNLSVGRLYGSVFSDLGVLRSMVPDSPVVTEMVADLHRRLGQWEPARAIYTELSQSRERGGNLAAAYSNLGVYHHRRGDYETAANYFQRAGEADPTLAEAYFNLSQAYSQLFDFSKQHEAMAKAKALDADSVERWNRADVSAEESAVAVDGGLRRADELRARLDRLWRGQERRSTISGLWQRYRALSVAVAAILLAAILHQLRRQVGYRSRRLAPATLEGERSAWLRTLVPGLASADDERGGLAFLALVLPAGLVMVPLMRGLGFRAPFASDPGNWLALGVTGVCLLLWMLVRLSLSRST